MGIKTDNNLTKTVGEHDCNREVSILFAGDLKKVCSGLKVHY